MGSRLENVPGFPSDHVLGQGFGIALHRTIRPPHRNLTSRHGVDLERENVFGIEDTWTRILNTNSVPWRSICHLESTFTDGSVTFGTGWLSAPDTVITAAHNIYLPESRSWAKHVRVVAGRNEDVGFAETYAVNIHILDGWASHSAPERDLGAIKLANKDFGYGPGWFGFASLTDDQINAAPPLQSAGYPFETRPFASMWYDAGRGFVDSDEFLGYYVDTEGGQSGAPVFFTYAGDQRLVAAIHVYGGSTSNLGLRITPAIYDQILAWNSG